MNYSNACNETTLYDMYDITDLLLVCNGMVVLTTVCHKIIFHYLNEYNSTNVADILKSPFD